MGCNEMLVKPCSPDEKTLGLYVHAEKTETFVLAASLRREEPKSLR
jgi:hypothetical protein